MSKPATLQPEAARLPDMAPPMIPSPTTPTALLMVISPESSRPGRTLSGEPAINSRLSALSKRQLVSTSELRKPEPQHFFLSFSGQKRNSGLALGRVTTSYPRAVTLHSPATCTGSHRLAQTHRRNLGHRHMTRRSVDAPDRTSCRLRLCSL